MSERWGLFPWFAEDGDQHVHPSDRRIFDEVHPYGKVFQRVGEEDEYVTLLYEGGEVRVRPELFTAIPAPLFKLGDAVETVPPRRFRRGIVVSICWHHERAEPFYLLRVDGKRHRSRYFASELRSTG